MIEIGSHVAFEADGPATGEVVKVHEPTLEDRADRLGLPIWREPAVQIQHDETGDLYWRPTASILPL